MSFELGFLTSLGRNATAERAERIAREKEERELQEKRNSNSLSMMQKLIETDDLLPDEARSVLAQRLPQLAFNAKAKDKDFTSALQEAFTVASKPRMSPESRQRQGQADQFKRDFSGLDFAGLDALVPGAGSGMNRTISEMRPPEPKYITSPLLTREERMAREDEAAERKFNFESRLIDRRNEGRPDIRVVPAHDGIYTYDNRTGKQVGFEPFRSPKPITPDRSLSPMEVELNALDPSDPQYKSKSIEIARRYGTLQYTNQGDTPRPTHLVPPTPAGSNNYGGFDPTYLASQAELVRTGKAKITEYSEKSGERAALRQFMVDNQVAPPPKQPTEAQAKAYGYFQRAKDANDVFADVEKKFGSMNVMSQAWIASGPEWMQTEDGRMYRQAQRQFTEARLRKDSGAAIPPSEFENDKVMYFPLPGDSPTVIARKAAARKVLVESLERQGAIASPDSPYFGGQPGDAGLKPTHKYVPGQGLVPVGQ